jgi:hypothetical protein
MDETKFLTMFTVRDLKTLLEVLFEIIHDLLASESEFDMLVFLLIFWAEQLCGFCISSLSATFYIDRGISYVNLLNFAVFVTVYGERLPTANGTVLTKKTSQQHNLLVLTVAISPLAFAVEAKVQCLRIVLIPLTCWSTLDRGEIIRSVKEDRRR